MKVVEINSVPYGSTGMIAKSIANINARNGESFFAYSWTKKRKSKTSYDEILIGNFFDKLFHIWVGKITGFECCFSYFATKKFIRKLDEINPDIVHLHNLHCWYININLLFSYLKEKNIKVIWTLHDCWSFTGHCPHFQIANCDKWKTQCFNCKSYKSYPQSFFDNSKKMYNIKKEVFTKLDEKNVVIVTPSVWLYNIVSKSFLGKYNIKIINNGIDLKVFKPTESDFRKKYNLEDKFIILGVAMDWSKRKGLDVFKKLSCELDDNYKVVLVGTNSKIDKDLPTNIISIHRTSNKEELAGIYSSSDVFVNPTREDTFPTVNIEALACGKPVITYKTGGSPEIINEKSGYVIEKDDYISLIEKIKFVKKNKPFLSTDCINQSKKFDLNEKFMEYIKLFDDIKKEIKYE